jgi:hypothetical protein
MPGRTDSISWWPRSDPDRRPANRRDRLTPTGGPRSLSPKETDHEKYRVPSFPQQQAWRYSPWPHRHTHRMSRGAVQGGGISAPGWMGVIDASEEKAWPEAGGRAARARGGGAARATTGPSVVYWNPGEPGQRRLHGERHVPRGAYMSAEQPSAPVRHHRRGQRHGHGPAALPVLRRVRQRVVHRARLRPRTVPAERARVRAARGDQQGGGRRANRSRSQIALSVTPDRVECAINGTVVGSYDRAAVLVATASWRRPTACTGCASATTRQRW